MIKVNELPLSSFFKISEILNKDQYEFKKQGKKFVRGKKVKKEERTQDFIFELYREVVGELSGLGKEYIKDDTFIDIAIDEITQKYTKLNSLLNEKPNIKKLKDDSFFMNESELKFSFFNDWTFNKWVIFENATKGHFRKKPNGDIEIIERGEKFVLPICFGDWFDEMPLFSEKYNYFNNEILAADALPVFARVNFMINELKDGYAYIYSGNEKQDEKQKKNAFSSHVNLFGWQETLRDLAEKRIFGNYSELKQAPLLEVLEYLNVSVSREIARNDDFMANQK